MGADCKSVAKATQVRILHLPPQVRAYFSRMPFGVDRSVVIRAEHLFGPDYARALVDRDLTTIEELVAVTPTKLRSEVRRAAGRIAELGGWIAQDSGDPVKAEQLTRRAEDHVRSADPALRAMVSMRRSNILLASDPRLAVELAADAAQLIEGRSVGRLAVSVARQRALAAIADRDRARFVAHAAHALDIAPTEPVADDHAVYANSAYVAAEVASGFIAINQPAKALDLLLGHHHGWPAGQRRDHAVASLDCSVPSSFWAITVRLWATWMLPCEAISPRRPIEHAANCVSAAGSFATGPGQTS